MNVSEIFYSIDGEGVRAGYPSIFIRTVGCNLRCNYCDTTYAFTGGQIMSIGEVLTAIKQYNCKNVTLTGGEPLLAQDTIELLKQLYKQEYSVIVETNGSVDIGKAQKYASICMDWKVSSSGASHAMLESNIPKLRECDVLKFVVRSQDLQEVEEFLKNHAIRSAIYISPVFGDIELPEIADFTKRYGGRIAMQVQLHKVIWSPDKRGV